MYRAPTFSLLLMSRSEISVNVRGEGYECVGVRVCWCLWCPGDAGV